MTKKQLRVVDEIIDLAIHGDLNIALNKALSISLLLESDELSNWIECETNGYFDSNEVYLNAPRKVPVYRKIAGTYLTEDGRAITDYYKDLDFLRYYWVREGVAEIENMSRKNTMLSFQSAEAFKFISKETKVPVTRFAFSPNVLISVAQSIRNKLIKEFTRIKKQNSKATSYLSHNEELKLLQSYHPKIQQIAEQYFEDGHYRSAILDTYIALVNEVKHKSNISDKDGSPLMDAAFSLGNPKLKVSDDRNEQLGASWLFKGAVMFIRNANAHKVQPWEDSQRTLEWLGFASALFYTLDNSEIV